jgi:2-oxoisovalerate dehydrogenase E1 component
MASRASERRVSGIDLIEVDDALLIQLYRDLLRTRAFDERALHLQRTGRLPAYYPCAGMEAHVAVPLALDASDWIFTAYREQGVRLARGVPVLAELALWRGSIYAAWNPLEFRITPLNATIGTHLPHATGYGYGARLLGRDEVALAMFGDGATSEGDFHAALNAAGVWKTPTVFFCQNNLYAQSTPVAEQTAAATLAEKAAAYGIEGIRIDGMDVVAVYRTVRSAVEKARRGDGPTLIESMCYRYAPHSTYDGTPVYRTREEEKTWRDRDPIDRMRAVLEERGLLAANIEERTRDEMNAAVDAAIDELETMVPPPRDRSFLSVSAKLPARLIGQLHRDQTAANEALTDVPAERRLAPGEDPEPEGETRALTLVEALNLALVDAMERRPDTLILGEDVGREGGVFRVTAGLYERFGRERMLDTPLSEVCIAGTAIGMALAGARPVCEIEFAGFSLTAFDQIAFHMARYAWRTWGALRLPIVIRMPGGGGHEGYEGHSDNPEALYAHVPGGMTVIYPSNAYDAKGLLAAALECDDPVVFFEPVSQYFVKHPAVPVEHYTIPIGRARIVRPGRDVTVVAYGNAVGVAERAATQLEAEGASIEIIDLRTLKPWDEATVLASVARTGRLLVVHEAPISGGLGAEIVATVCENAADALLAPPARIGHADLPWAVAKLESQSLIDPARVVASVRELVAWS